MSDREPLTFVSDGDRDPTRGASNTNGAAPMSGVTKPNPKRRRLIIAAFVVFLGLWAYAITYSVTAGGRSPERLDDPTAHGVDTACIGAEDAVERPPTGQRQRSRHGESRPSHTRRCDPDRDG